MKGSYNYALVAFSIVIAVFASYTALTLGSRVHAARGRFRLAWLAGGSVAMGIGIWSMHFVGMLAHRLPVPITYDVPLWLLSMGVAVVASVLALWVASRPHVHRVSLAAAGLLMGAAIAGMHYVGMAAMRIPGRITYDPRLVAASIVIAVAAAGAALGLFLRTRADDARGGRTRKLGAALVMGAAISGMHYTAMAAARFHVHAGGVSVPQDHVLRTPGLAAGVIVGTLVLLGITLLSALVDRRMRARDAETEAVRRSEARFRSLVVASSQIVWTATPGGELAGPQPELAAYTGLPADRFGGWGWLEAVHPDDRDRVRQDWKRALGEKRVLQMEYRLRREDGAWRQVNVRAVPVLEPDGRVREWVGATEDVTERRRVEAARGFIVEASRVLASSLDYEKTLRAVADLAVPGLADWCAVDVLTDDGELRRLAVQHTDPHKVRLVQEIEARWPTPLDAPYGVAHVVRTGRPELVPHIPDDLLRANAVDDEHLRVVRDLGLRSYVCVPFVARGRVLGALSLVHAESGRAYDEADLGVAEELGRRGAMAIDNARLFGETEEARHQLEQQTAELEEAQAEMEMAHDELQRAYEDLAERTREAERAREAADEANAAKSAFLATMSHELRTPLNAIAGYTQLLEMGIHGDITQPQRESLEKIRRNQTHLLGLINDVLNFAKIEAGQVQYALDDVPLDATLAAVEALVEPQIRARGLAYRYHPGDGRTTVRADRERMEQVVLNLLTNAVKFTDPGGRVELWWETEGRWARIHVRDTGRGIPADKLEAIFEPFVQVDPALTRSAEGTGLGLAISRDLARAMRGDLTARSAEGQGSTFTLTLPLGRPLQSVVSDHAAD
ncbi:MHYT domain-containing protein [Longimicrobium sp.]|uniref:sensor histidine kinase n=1 Tax=Longimicrobium sp. TaxID=2029185 RepID=UPI002E33CA4F|nr:MHYT domain-containing protein [Longimicrobium sp.]HEX6041418.1 MHYT domain-containing protein [Longimicrobium sp.]